MDRTPEQVWKECLDIIRDNISRQSFKTWFAPLKPIKLEQDQQSLKLIIEVPSRFYYEWLEEHYFSLLRKTITKVLGSQGRLQYDIVIEKDHLSQKANDTGHLQIPAHPLSSPSQQTSLPFADPRLNPSNQAPRNESPSYQTPMRYAQAPSANVIPLHPAGKAPPASPFVIPGIKKVEVDSQLNPAYTFERFIEGDCNRLALSAGRAIAERPGETSFNPFLVYGGVGLGKTHLIQAIGNYARQNRKIDSILYVSSERFTTEFVQSIQHNRVSEFSLFYRQIDLLIVDDVQFFGRKEKTQEEFFHIFNALHQTGKQIILCADRPPKDIEGIEERLLSRFTWGLTADVQPPDLETRIAILQRKAEDEGLHIAPDVIEFIAHNITSNIRELEGALIRLLAHSAYRKEEIDLAFSKEILKDLVKETKLNLSIEEIQRIVCQYYSIPDDLVRGKTRKQEVVQARQVAMYFSKQYTKHSLKTIGLHFGGRDHSTVIHALQSIETYLEMDMRFQDTLAAIRHKIELQSH